MGTRSNTDKQPQIQWHRTLLILFGNRQCTYTAQASTPGDLTPLRSKDLDDCSEKPKKPEKHEKNFKEINCVRRVDDEYITTVIKSQPAPRPKVSLAGFTDDLDRRNL
jgi:hypothetical protein